MNGNTLTKVLNSISNQPISVIDQTITLDTYVSIDLSTTNKELINIDVSSSKEWEVYINNYLKRKCAKVAYGGYLEKRNLYKRSSNFNNSSIGNTERTIHLGIDLWCKEKTTVLAVLDGEIHSFQNNRRLGDYGPTIILKHTVEGFDFFSLYGHLNSNALKNIKIGQKVKRGTVIGALGNANVNGDYAPHLHFQLIDDVQNKVGDYLGVSSEKDLDFYRKNCPDPNLLLKLI